MKKLKVEDTNCNDVAILLAILILPHKSIKKSSGVIMKISKKFQTPYIVYLKTMRKKLSVNHIDKKTQQGFFVEPNVVIEMPSKRLVKIYMICKMSSVDKWLKFNTFW